jgi:hypothetical protein
VHRTDAASYSLFGINAATDKVIRIDLTTGIATDFAPLPFDADLNGFDYRKADGKLYISHKNGAGGVAFYSVDPFTAEVTLTDKTITGLGDIANFSIGFTDAGDLYAYHERSAFATGSLYFINWTSMAYSEQPNGTRSPSVLGGDYDEKRNVFWASDEWDGKIYQIDATTGQRVWTSSSSWFGALSGDMLDMDVTPDGEVLAYAQGPYGQTNMSYEVLSVNPNDGTWSTLLTVEPGIHNIATVPEPSTYALLLIGGAASLWALRRRKS